MDDTQDRPEIGGPDDADGTADRERTTTDTQSSTERKADTDGGTTTDAPEQRRVVEDRQPADQMQSEPRSYDDTDRQSYDETDQAARDSQRSKQEPDALEIYNRIVEGKGVTKPVEVETKHGTLQFRMHPLSRSERWEYMSDLPPGMFGDLAGGGAELNQDLDVVPDGDAITSMESLLAESLESDMLAPDEIRYVIENMNDRVMFEFAFEVIEHSMELGDVTGFRTK